MEELGMKENKMISITEEESLLLQCLSITALLGELSNDNFLDSPYFERLPFANEGYKKILKMSGIGNPAAMQMMLYASLIVPKELLSRTAYNDLETYITIINPLVYSLIEQDTYSTYDNEESTEKINYFRHIRNAVAHSKCNYFSENQKNYVVFKDNMKSKKCEIKMECLKVGVVLTELHKLIIEYHNNKHTC